MVVKLGEITLETLPFFTKSKTTSRSYSNRFIYVGECPATKEIPGCGEFSLHTGQVKKSRKRYCALITRQPASGIPPIVYSTFTFQAPAVSVYIATNYMRAVQLKPIEMHYRIFLSSLPGFYDWKVCHLEGKFSEANILFVLFQPRNLDWMCCF